MPIIRMIALSVCWSVGTRWLTSALRPVAASTAENARRTGSPAATSAPKATSRIRIVSGSEVSSARPISRSNRLSICWLAEASPNSSMIRLGLPAWASSIDFRIGAIRSFAFSASPLTSNWTRAECRSAETSPAPGRLIGETMFVTFGCCESVCTTPPTAAENAGSSTVDVRDCTSTLSRAGRSKFARSRICSARRDSPFATAQLFICCAPTRLPTVTASTANASHPKAAVFQCAALQRPARPAKLVVSIAFVPSPGVSVSERR